MGYYRFKDLIKAAQQATQKIQTNIKYCPSIQYPKSPNIPNRLPPILHPPSHNIPSHSFQEIMWNYLAWNVKQGSIYAISVLRQWNYWYPFEIFGLIHYIQCDYACNSYMFGCGFPMAWSTALAELGLHTNYDISQYPDGRTAGLPCLYEWGEDAEATGIDPEAGYTCIDDWLNEAPWEYEYSEDDQPDLYVPGPMFPFQGSLGSELSGYLFYPMPHKPHNTGNGNIVEDIDISGNHAEYKNSYDLTFGIYASYRGIDLSTFREAYDAWRIATEPTHQPKVPTEYGTLSVIETITLSTDEIVEEDSTITRYLLTIETTFPCDLVLEYDNDLGILDTYAGKGQIQFISRVPIAAWIVCNEDGTDQEFPVVLGSPLTLTTTLTLQCWWYGFTPHYDFLLERDKSFGTLDTDDEYWLALQIPAESTQNRLLPITCERFQVTNTQNTSPPVCDTTIDNVLVPFSGGTHTFSLLDHTPTYYNNLWGNSRFNSRKSVCFSYDAWQEVMHYNDGDDVYCQYINEPTVDSFTEGQGTYLNPNRLTHTDELCFNSKATFDEKIFGDQLQPLRRPFFVSVIPNYASYPNQTFYTGYSLFSDVYEQDTFIDTFLITFEAIIEDKTVIIRALIGQALSLEEESEDYAYFLANANIISINFSQYPSLSPWSVHYGLTEPWNRPHYLNERYDHIKFSGTDHLYRTRRRFQRTPYNPAEYHYLEYYWARSANFQIGLTMGLLPDNGTFTPWY